MQTTDIITAKIKALEAHHKGAATLDSQDHDTKNDRAKMRLLMDAKRVLEAGVTESNLIKMQREAGEKIAIYNRQVEAIKKAYVANKEMQRTLISELKKLADPTLCQRQLKVINYILE